MATSMLFLPLQAGAAPIAAPWTDADAVCYTASVASGSVSLDALRLDSGTVLEVGREATAQVGPAVGLATDNLGRFVVSTDGGAIEMVLSRGFETVADVAWPVGAVLGSVARSGHRWSMVTDLGCGHTRDLGGEVDVDPAACPATAETRHQVRDGRTYAFGDGNVVSVFDARRTLVDTISLPTSGVRGLDVLDGELLVVHDPGIELTRYDLTGTVLGTIPLARPSGGLVCGRPAEQPPLTCTLPPLAALAACTPGVAAVRSDGSTWATVEEAVGTGGDVVAVCPGEHAVSLQGITDATLRSASGDPSDTWLVQPPGVGTGSPMIEGSRLTVEALGIGRNAWLGNDRLYGAIYGTDLTLRCLDVGNTVFEDAVVGDGDLIVEDSRFRDIDNDRYAIHALPGSRLRITGSSFHPNMVAGAKVWSEADRTEIVGSVFAGGGPTSGAGELLFLDGGRATLTGVVFTQSNTSNPVRIEGADVRIDDVLVDVFEAYAFPYLP